MASAMVLAERKVPGAGIEPARPEGHGILRTSITHKIVCIFHEYGKSFEKVAPHTRIPVHFPAFLPANTSSNATSGTARKLLCA